MLDFIESVNFIETGKKTENHLLLEKANIPVKYLSKGNCKRSVLIDLYKYLKKVQADAFICHFASGTHITACILAGKTPLILIAMGQDILREGAGRTSPLQFFFLRTSVRKADYIFAKSRYLIQRLNDWGINKKKIGLNYWGVDLDLFKPGDKTAAKKKLGIPVNQRIILSSRAFAQHYNIHLIAEAFANLAKEDSNIEILFLGRPSDEKYVSKVKKIFEVNNCKKRAHFIFNVGVNEIIDYYHAADIAVSMSSTEGFPNTIFELMACKVPVLVGRIHHLTGLLEDKKNVIFCNFDSNDIYKKLIWAFDSNNSNELYQIKLEGLKLVEKYGDIKNNAMTFVNEINSLQGKTHKWFPIDVLFLILIEIFWKRICFLKRKIIIKNHV